MISALVDRLKPVLLPLLKLDLKPPHLPEGVTLVRHLTPAPAWLGLRYARVFLQGVPQLLGLSFALVVVSATRERLALYLVAALFVLLFIGFVISLATTRIDFELRHYLVGDRSLRVTEGALVRREVTLSYANVQNLEVLQGPLDRLFGIKSLMVSTAGGEQVAPGQRSTHQVTLAGIADADAVRTLILGMVKQQRDQGLGELPSAAPPAGLDASLLAEVRDAAQALRAAAVGRIAQAPSSEI